MRMHTLLACSLALLIAGTNEAADRMVPVICKHGDLHTMPLAESEPGAPGSREAPSVEMGPSQSVWLQLPSGASLADAQLQPIPVSRLDSATVEVLVSHGQGRVEPVEVPVSTSAGEGLTAVTLIRVRTGVYNYVLPETCRMRSGAEVHDYALALLNNAGCLMPSSAHEALGRVPGAPRSLRRDCGWPPDARLAVHLLSKAAARGSLDAGWVLSQFYLGSVAPEYRDLQAAYLQLSRIGALGHASADLMAGIMRWRGNGLESNAEAAFPILLPYARLGSREAQGIVGTMYLTGEGVPESHIQAYAWCSLAAADAPLMYSDPVACRNAAEDGLSDEQMLDARDLAVEIHNGHY